MTQIRLIDWFRVFAGLKYAGPDGVIRPRGQYHHATKAGPGRRPPSPGRIAGECRHGSKWVGRSSFPRGY